MQKQTFGLILSLGLSAITAPALARDRVVEITTTGYAEAQVPADNGVLMVSGQVADVETVEARLAEIVRETGVEVIHSQSLDTIWTTEAFAGHEDAPAGIPYFARLTGSPDSILAARDAVGDLALEAADLGWSVRNNPEAGNEAINAAISKAEALAAGLATSRGCTLGSVTQINVEHPHAGTDASAFGDLFATAGIHDTYDVIDGRDLASGSPEDGPMATVSAQVVTTFEAVCSTD